MLDMTPKNPIKLETIELDKTYPDPEENVLSKDDLYRYLCQPREQHRDQKRLYQQTLSGVKICID